MNKQIILKERYRTLSELWIPKSTHQTHVKISKMMDDTLLELKELDCSDKSNTECLHPYHAVRRDKISEKCTCTICEKEWY